MRLSAYRVTFAVVIACVAVLPALAGCSLVPETRGEPTAIVNVPRRDAGLPTPPGTVELPTLPAPESTVNPSWPTPGITPTQPIPTITPTPALLQPAVVITPSTVSTVTFGLEIELEIESAVNSVEPIVSLTWAPTDDKLLYLTNSGKLYWSNQDGTEAVLLHTYDTHENERVWDLFEGQIPLGNTLYAQHRGLWTGEVRLPSHMDRIRFTPGQPPTLVEQHDPPMFWEVRWWSPDRASAILGMHYMENAYYVGGERLVILNTDGYIVEERNIPYMSSAAVRPGGDWLIYTTGQQARGISIQNSYPEVAYLLNMQTGERLQLTAPGAPISVGRTQGWSPDGSWFLLDVFGGDPCGPRLVSADGREQIVIEQMCGSGLWDAVWSPDSKRFAFSIQSGGCDSPPTDPCPPYTSKVYMVDVPSKRLAQISLSALQSSHLMKPRWSSDGSTLALLSFDPECSQECSGLTPAFYLASVK